ncbi:hypothetical protein Aau02nite_15940 [Amorphoplanes auranticolor]|uniref:Uncharacterized protein n=1 Tax=Actinoplanes auranticolor TaxID=47988 RepID=A0A919VH95_9ACTN|nr:hypothetical protein Aau02nite_15940 [Actinoplanes auranticolor]
MASLRSAGTAPREVGAEATENDHGKGRLVIFGVLDTDGRSATLGAVEPRACRACHIDGPGWAAGFGA